MVAVTVMSFGVPAHAQTDYYNTDAGRPVRIEDAYPTERHAFELQLAPVRVERGSGGLYTWGIEPEIAYGVLPRTHVEIGLPLAFFDAAGTDGTAGGAGVHLSVLHNLNAETLTFPAFALGARVLLPAGRFGPDAAFPSLAALMTRSFPAFRIHANGQYTLGDDTDGGAAEVSRWLAGVAIDRTFPLRSLLITGEAFAEQPLDAAEALAWSVGAGIRAQRSPRLAIDLGAGRRVTGDTGWYITAGAAYAFAVRGLMPGGDR